MFKKQLLPMKLQYFAENTDVTETAEPKAPEFDAENLTDEQLAAIKEKFGFKDDTDVDKIIKSKHSRWQKELESEKQEAEKLAKMNADEKAEHERKKLEERLAEYERKEVLSNMGREAKAMLKEKNVKVNDEVLSLLVKENADDTKGNVNAFVEYMESERKRWEIERNTGTTPKVVPEKTEIDVFKQAAEKY
ncbi:DUF4355 domain-containing protein [Enterococcus italicus]|uniref:DUF4355 domain-containing protein n=1 Tax=Enterococcus italicus TaxID=246144 RepID=UPI003F470F59